MSEKRIALLIKLGVIALSAGAFYVSQIIAKYPHRSIELGAAAATMTLLANRIPAAFRRKKKPGVLPLPPTVGLFILAVLLLTTSGCAGLRRHAAPAASDERCQALEAKYQVWSGLAAAAGVLAAPGVPAAVLPEDKDVRLIVGVGELLVIAFGSAAIVVRDNVQQIYAAECDHAREPGALVELPPLEPQAIATSTVVWP